MFDLLAATAVFTGAFALGLALLAAVTLVPFVLTLQLAETRRFSSARWGSVSLAGSLLAGALVLLVLRSDRPALLAVVALPMAFLGPLLLSALQGSESVGGRVGRHQ